MYFSEIPGQGELKSYFTRLVLEDRVPHAIMLIGGEGYGKLQMALGLSTLLQCQNISEKGACQECKACTKSRQLIHPDLHLAFPVIKKDKLKREDTTSKDFLEEFRAFVEDKPYGDINDWLAHLGAIDKQANINKAECAKIIKNLGLQSYEGKYKIQIIWCADYLGKEGNRLLKLIEEPTDDTIIILIANSGSRVLNTLRSRCQMINVPPVSDEEVIAYISHTYELSEEDTQELAFLASGNLRKAQMLGHRQELNYSEDLLSWLRNAYQSDPEVLVSWVDERAIQGKQELINFLEYGLHYFREYLLFLNTKDTESLRLTSTEKEVVLKMGKIVDIDKTSSIKELFEQSIRLIPRNVALKPLLMTMSLQLNAILKSEVDNFV